MKGKASGGKGESGNNLWRSKLDVAASLVMVATGGGCGDETSKVL